MKRILISIMIWTVSTILIIVLFFAMLFFSVVLFFSDKQRKMAHAQCFWWADAMFKLNPYWSVSVSGLENIDRTKTYVIVANHQSLADIIVLYKMKMQYKWVAKESLFRIPFLGWCMTLGKHIKLYRGNFGSIKQVYREAAILLREGMSVLFFPEGTRSETNTMKEFQNGAFKLAIKERVPVLPIAISGTGNAMPKGSWLFEPNIPAKLKVLPPIDTTQFAMADFDKLKDMAHSMIKCAR